MIFKSELFAQAESKIHGITHNKLMTFRRPSLHYWLLSLLLIAMLVPTAQADFDVVSEPASHEQAMDCHAEHAAAPQHQHNTDCAQNCDCPATGCHANAAFSQQHQAATSTIIINTLTALFEHTVSQSPAKFERPPRS